jgi:hypothetical protein
MTRSHRPRVPESIDHYREITGLTVGGATEKDILEDPATKAWYIAKLGRRNNDLEVMTEYIIHLVGRNLGARVADAKIARYKGRLRFLSKYFLDPAQDEELVHGIQLFREFYDEVTMRQVIGNEAREQQMFSLQAIRSAFGAHYLEYGPDVERSLFKSLVDMVVHDAIIGVQDRHHENWGVIVQRGRAAPPPRFAPLYDSARGLFCNERDDRLARRVYGSPGWLVKYVAKSRPLMSWEGLAPSRGRRFVTHEQLVAAIFRVMPDMRCRINGMLDRYEWRSLRDEIQRNVGLLCSPMRLHLVLLLLRRRIHLIKCAIR